EVELDTRATVALIGDSILASGTWERQLGDVTIASFAVPGYTSDDALARLDEVVEADPEEILVLVGTNDLGLGRSVEHLVRNVEVMLVELRSRIPGSRLLLQSILPRGAEFAPAIRDANIHLRQFSATVRAQDLDLWPRFADADGALKPELTSDGLHLSPQGYDAWLEELLPALERLREQPPMSRPLRIPLSA